MCSRSRFHDPGCGLTAKPRHRLSTSGGVFPFGSNLSVRIEYDTADEFAPNRTVQPYVRYRTIYLLSMLAFADFNLPGAIQLSQIFVGKPIVNAPVQDRIMAGFEYSCFPGLQYNHIVRVEIRDRVVTRAQPVQQRRRSGRIIVGRGRQAAGDGDALWRLERRGFEIVVQLRF